MIIKIANAIVTTNEDPATETAAYQYHISLYYLSMLNDFSKSWVVDLVGRHDKRTHTAYHQLVCQTIKMYSIY